jgi:hypothetical protein
LPSTLDARRRAGLGPGLGVRMQLDQLKRRDFITLLGGAAASLAGSPFALAQQQICRVSTTSRPGCIRQQGAVWQVPARRVRAAGRGAPEKSLVFLFNLPKLIKSPSQPHQPRLAWQGQV